jgi:hypothetical protein
MNVKTLPYSIEAIKCEACQLVDQGLVCCQQPIYTLCQFIPAREWQCFECELERNDYCLRDRIIDLLDHQEWDND